MAEGNNETELGFLILFYCFLKKLLLYTYFFFLKKNTRFWLDMYYVAKANIKFLEENAFWVWR